MDAGAVAALATHENELWDRGSAMQPAAAPHAGAYVPLDGRTGHTGDAEPSIEFVDATAVGTVLVVRFRWPSDEHDRDLLLPIDFRDYPHGLEGASTWLLEYVRQNLDHDRSWFPRDVVSVSDGAAIIRPSRSPGYP